MNLISGSRKSLWLALAALAFAGLAQAAAISAPPIVFQGSGFNPMVSNVVSGTTLTFVNAGSTPLQLMSAADSPMRIKEKIKPGARADLAFSKPGVYLLYDAETTSFAAVKISGASAMQVVARQESPYFPLPAYAVVVVLNPDGGGIPPTKAEVSIPGNTMVFVPWVTVVKAWTPILFTNQDEDPHVVAPGPDAMMMHGEQGAASPSHTKYDLETMQAYKPLYLRGGGGTATLVLGKPGVYHYYCAIHAFYSPENSTYAPQKSFGGYPYVQDGLIVVLPGSGAE